VTRTSILLARVLAVLVLCVLIGLVAWPEEGV